MDVSYLPPNDDDVMQESLSEENVIIDPLFDAGFKLTFGRETVSECLLIDLLNSIFEGDPKFGNIVSIKYLNTEYQGESIEGKTLRYDVMCSTSNGHRFIVEMQKGYQKHFLERSQYYVDRAIVRQGYKGKGVNDESWDYSFEPVVGVFFCNFHVPELPLKAVVKGRLFDEETLEPMGDYTRFVYIQIPFFNKDKQECVNQLERWIFNIKNMGFMQSVAFTANNDIFKYLESVSNVAALSPIERERYEAELKRARDYNAVVKSAKEMGESEGLEKGIVKGEEMAKFNMSRNLFKQGVSLKVIAEAAGVTIQKIKEWLGIENE